MLRQTASDDASILPTVVTPTERNPGFENETGISTAGGGIKLPHFGGQYFRLGVMISVLFDTNIYDLLQGDVATQEAIRRLVDACALQVVVSRTVEEELARSPFSGTPQFFEFVYVGNTVGNVDMSVDDSIGSGEVFDAHLGNSRKDNDAYIADAASWHADWLVSQDDRLRTRFSSQVPRCKALTYAEFVAMLPVIPQQPCGA